jgi:Family of unknown function (DUF6270)
MTVAIDILGSCVTRDAFAMVENDYTLASYNPRASLISVYSPPLEVDISEIGLKSEYQQRLVYLDVTKHFRAYVRATTADVLIVDFVDERLGVVELDGTYISNSFEFRQSQLRRAVGGRAVEFDHDYVELWKASALQLCADVNERPFKNVILHKAYYMDTYINADGVRGPITDPAVVQKIQPNNELLARMYDFIEARIPGIGIIMPVGHSADEKHRWGPSPFHYEQAYYADFMDRLGGLVADSATREPLVDGRPAAGR